MTRIDQVELLAFWVMIISFIPVSMTTQNDILNGDFEGGHIGWEEYSQQRYEIILESDPQFLPLSGSTVAWLGGDNTEISYLISCLVFEEHKKQEGCPALRLSSPVFYSPLFFSN